MSEIEYSEDAKVLYHGETWILTFGRSSTTGQWIKFAAPDEEQFSDIVSDISGSVPVYVTLENDDGLYLESEEFLLKAASSSSRTMNNLRLQYSDMDEKLYAQTSKWHEGETKLNIIIIAGEYAKKQSKESGKYKHVAKRIRSAPILTNQEFLAHVGSEEKFIKWLQRQKCCLSGSFWKNPETGEELNEAAHIRAAIGKGGVAVKPKYYAVPLHYKLHRWQHDHSMTELWSKHSYGKGHPKNNHYRRLPASQQYPIQSASHAAHEFFIDKVHSYMRKWVEHEILEWAGVTRLSYVSEEKLIQWLESINAEQYFEELM